MIPRPHGPHDWSEGDEVVGMRRWRTWRLLLVVLLLVPIAGACRKHKPSEAGAGAGAAGGMGEEGLTGSSLDRAKRGLSPEEDGILKDVHFGYDKYDLDSEAREVLGRNLEWLRQNPRAKVEIEG